MLVSSEAPQFGNFPEAITTVGNDTQWKIPLFYRYLANSVIVTPLSRHTTRQLSYVRRAERMQYRCKYPVQVGSLC